jgi:diadenylate cyclase
MSFLIPGFNDIIDIFFVAYLLYKVILIFKEHGGFQILYGLFSVIFLYFLSTILNLNMTSSFFRFLKDYWVIAFLVLFQNEIRAFLSNFIKKSNIFVFFKKKEQSFPIIEEIIGAVRIMAVRRIGALIVFERTQKLDDYISGKPVFIDAIISQKLLLTIFNPKTLLHDGAVIIRNNRIYAARVLLPNAFGVDMDKVTYGTRHVAAMGISKITDALVIIISEESGKVSIAKEGEIYRDIPYDKLSDELKDVLQT